MKKRLLLVLMALTLSLGLVACSGNGGSSDKEERESKASEVSVKKYSSYEDLIDGLVRNVNDRSMDKWDFAAISMPAFYVEYQKTIENIKCGMSSDYKDEYEEDMDELFENIYDDLSDRFGENFEMSIEIRDEEELKKAELKEYKESLKEFIKYFIIDEENDVDGIDSEEYYEEMLEELEDEYDASYDDDDIEKLVKAGEKCIEAVENIKIEEGYKLRCKVRFEGDDEESYDCDIYVIKCDSYWLIGDVKWDDYDDVPSTVRRLF